MDILNHLLVKVKIEERLREAEHQHLVDLARGVHESESMPMYAAPHAAHYRVIRRLNPRELSIFSLPRHERAV